MADAKISADLNLTSPAAGDLVPIVDIDVADSLKNKTFTWSQIVSTSQTQSVTGLKTFAASTLGGFTDYDLQIGDVTTPDYGILRIGAATFGRTSRVNAALDLDGTVVLINNATPPTSNILYAMLDGSNSIRWALPKSAVGNATYNPRSMLMAGPAPLDDECVTVGYWQTQGIFHNLVCDTSVSGADLGVQGSFEVEGIAYMDTIAESTPAAGVTIDGVLLKDNKMDWSYISNAPASYTPSSHTLLSHTITGETAGHVLAADSATTYSIRQLLGSEINNDQNWAADQTLGDLGVNATAGELNVLDLSATALTAGWVYKATGASTAAWGQLAGSQINNDQNWNNYSLPLAADGTRGGVQIGYTETGQNYPVELSIGQKMFVNVPWTDTVYTLPLATNTVRGGIELFSNTDNPTAANTVTSTASRTYGLQLNAANQGVVNVPWTDTVYSHPTHPGDDAAVDTGLLSGDVMISDLDFNITTDTLGHVTDANATVATRTYRPLAHWATSHPTQYYNVVNWVGSTWYITNNHGSDVRVARANQFHTARTINGVSFDGTANITIPAGIEWNYRTTSLNPLVKANGYAFNGSSLTATLPATCAVGDEIIINNAHSTALTVADNGRNIQYKGVNYTANVTLEQGDTMHLVCIVANSVWLIV